MYARVVSIALTVSVLAFGQQIGKTPEVHPKLTTQTCTKYGGCTTHDTSVVLDSGTHRIKDIHTGTSCETAGELNSTVCATAEDCAKNCALEGVNYAQHGIKTNGDSMTMHYEMLKLLGQELSFDVDVSNLPCGMNGALYLTAMDATGGRSKLNPAGATYGTGYCDAQCYNTSAFINGVANVNTLGACCNEMDIWEANSRATALTPHTCNVTGFYECAGASCGPDGVCDKDGCGFNPYALGAHKYYGLHEKVDTTKPLTVVTRFLTDDGTTSGTLDEVRRLYIQNGKVIQNANVKFDKPTIDSITPRYCNATADSFTRLGGLQEIGDSLGRGMVLIFAIWNDPGGYMNWLDAGTSGPCNSTEGNPTVIETEDPGTSVTFSNIKWGDIGSTNDCES